MLKHVRYARRNAATYERFTRDAYLDNAADVTREDGNIAVYNRLLFALLSVNTDYAVTAAAYTAMRNKYWHDAGDIMREYMRHGIHYAGARSAYLADATELFITNPFQFLKAETETWNDYRFRLVKIIPGLSFCKVSFFIGMIYRKADVCCIDRHMIRALGYRDVNKTLNAISHALPSCDRRYRTMESRIRNQNKTNLGLPAFQWAIWDSIQNQSNNMEVLS